MKLDKLRLKGFIGIRDGLGMEEIEVDFSGVSGLTAFSGENGSGKSTVLGSCQPFPRMIGKEDESLYKNVYLRNSEKMLSFFYNGDHYRTLVKIDCQSEQSEGYIWKGLPADQRSRPHAQMEKAVANACSQVNGKITQYKKYIEALFGSPELFFASIFAAQNAEKMSDMQVGDLRKLFAEFLQLDKLEKQAKLAGDCANVLSGKAGVLDSRIANLQTVVENKSWHATEIDEAHAQAERLRRERTIISLTLVEKRAEIDRLKEIISNNALALERKTDLQAQISRLDEELAKEKSAAEGEIKALSEKWTATRAEIGGFYDLLQKKTQIENAAKLQQSLEFTLSGLLATVEEMNADYPVLQKKVHDLETEITALRQSIVNVETDPEFLRIKAVISENERAVADKEKELAALDRDPEVLRIKQVLAHAEADAKVGDGIDADCKSTTCAAIKNVQVAQESLPIILAALSQRQLEVGDAQGKIIDYIDSIRPNAENLQQKATRIGWIAEWNTATNERISAVTKEVGIAQKSLIATGEILAAKRQAIATARAEILRQKALADRLPEIRVAEARKADLEKQLAEVTEAGQAKKTAWEEKEKAAEARMSELRFNIRHIEMQIDQSAETMLQGVQWDIQEIETTKIPGIEKEIQTTRDKIAQLQAELTKIVAAEKELAEVTAGRGTLAVGISRWRYLQIACGAKGIQALEISGAAPLITGHANKLLAEAFGNLSSINLRTQDDDGRECLYIVVIGEDGKESKLGNKSGGQMVWYLMALRLGMTLLSKEKNDKNFQTAFCDELDGALDPERAQNFIGMYRAFMEIGRFKDLLFISHKAICRAMADHVLTFEHGKNPGWV